MPSKLILISGPPGVGKSKVATRLCEMLDECAWLDGDDVWRMRPFRVDAESVSLAERNIVAVLRNYLSAGCSHVILTWVLHQREIIDRILEGLNGVSFDVSLFTLLCDKVTLESRWRGTHPGEADTSLPMRRLQECALLDSVHIDTTNLTAQQVATSILEAVVVAAEPPN